MSTHFGAMEMHQAGSTPPSGRDAARDALRTIRTGPRPVHRPRTDTCCRAPPCRLPSSTAAPCSGCRPPRSRSRSTSPTACPRSRWSAWPTPRSRKHASGCARRCSTAGWTSRTTGASPSISRRPICPRRAVASTCRSRWASWPRPATSMQRRSTGWSSPANSLWRATCARCAARCRWRWRCSAAGGAAPWCCPGAAPRRPHWCRAWRCAAPTTSTRSSRRCSRSSPAIHPPRCCRGRARSRCAPAPACPTCRMCAGRPRPSGRSRSPRPGGIRCCWSVRPEPASRCWRSAWPGCCRRCPRRRRWNRPRC